MFDFVSGHLQFFPAPLLFALKNMPWVGATSRRLRYRALPTSEARLCCQPLRPKWSARRGNPFPNGAGGGNFEMRWGKFDSFTT